MSKMSNKRKWGEARPLTGVAYHPSQLDVVESIRRGIAQACKGMGRPADDVFDDLEREDAADR